MGIALIGGAGEGLGAALGRRFSKGYDVVLSSRTQGEKADLREEAEVLALFERVESRAPVEVAIFNAGANFRSPIVETPAEMFEKVWRLGCYAGFLFAREAARQLGPKNIHVAHVVIDGMIDNPRTRSRMAERVRDLPAQGMLATDAIAELFWQLHAQPRSAWTFEADLRPWAEKF